MDVFKWLNNPKPVFADQNAANPALPLPSWQITGTPLPVPVAAEAKLYSQRAANVFAFPGRSLVAQPRRITSIA